MPSQADAPGQFPIPNIRWERYVMAVRAGMQKDAAYSHAGFSNNKKGAYWRLDQNKIVKARFLWLGKKTAEHSIEVSAVTRTEIIESLRNTRLMAKEGFARGGKDGRSTEIKVDLNAANRCDEILAKMHGFMLDVTRGETLDEELDGKSPEELREFVLSLLEQLDPNMAKMLMAQMDAPEGTTLQ